MNSISTLGRSSTISLIFAAFFPSGLYAQTVTGSQASGAINAAAGVSGVSAGVAPSGGIQNIASLQANIGMDVRGLQAPVPKSLLPAPSVLPTQSNLALPSNKGEAGLALTPALSRFAGEGARKAALADAAAPTSREAASREAPSAKTLIQALRRVLSRLFDGTAKPKAAADPVAGSFAEQTPNGLAKSEQYLASAPEIPLPGLSTPWRKANAPRGSDGSVRYQTGEPQNLAPEHEWTFPSELAFEDAADKLEPTQAEQRGDDLVTRSRWRTTTGVAQAARLQNGFVWLDQDGDLYYRDAKAGKTSKVVPPSGKVEAFAASTDGDFLYVVANGILQRWILASKRALKIEEPTLKVEGPARLEAVTMPGKTGKPTSGVMLSVKGANIFWVGDQLVKVPVGEPEITGRFGVLSTLEQHGNDLLLEKTSLGTRLWRKAWQGSESLLTDSGELPFAVGDIIETPERGVFLAASEAGLVEWDIVNQRYRIFPMPGLKGAGIRLQATLDRKEEQVESVLLTDGQSIARADIADAKGFLATGAAQARLWAMEHPMSIEGGALHIGDFTFPLAKKAPKPVPFYKQLWGKAMRALSLRTAPPEAEALGISEKDWKAVNLPSNKKVIYDTLKAFTLHQHVLYIGETGGGKTYIAEMIAKLTGNDLWMVSMNEYTRNKDLIARETFGEEGKGRTGLTASTVLRWMQEGGVLLLDEMHKPLEGIAVLNNVLQNGEYRLPDGRIVKYDKTKSWVIGTMNPVKPPYKGEPPSGELSSRFGMTLDVKYLPAEEEAALLRIFFDKVDPALIEKLVAIANELRKSYPDVLPLPIAPRTLLHIVEHIQRFPKDSVTDIFTKTYNPSSIVEDPSIDEAIRRVLEAHALPGSGK
ncbi:MAG: AAA family ATPase [Elusimicrobia bacterium]|nr:AAA family ATPase [Elusimicrobiota bacterium]